MSPHAVLNGRDVWHGVSLRLFEYLYRLHARWDILAEDVAMVLIRSSSMVRPVNLIRADLRCMLPVTISKLSNWASASLKMLPVLHEYSHPSAVLPKGLLSSLRLLDLPKLFPILV